jgi:hypothetical protein
MGGCVQTKTESKWQQAIGFWVQRQPTKSKVESKCRRRERKGVSEVVVVVGGAGAER